MAPISSFLKKKYDFSHLFINGCSHSAGSEIEGSGIGEGNYNRENCFGAQLASKLGVNYTNIALPGGSNDYINRSSTHWIIDNLELAKRSLFLIHWTGSSRSEIFFNSGNTEHYWQFVPYVSDRNVGHIHANHYAPIFPSKLKKTLDVLSRYMFVNEEHWEINRYLNIINLQTILEAHQIPYIFRNGFQSCAVGDRYSYYQTKINSRNFYKFDDNSESFFEHCIAAGFSVEGQKYWHHRKDAHTYWANRLYDQNFA